MTQTQGARAQARYRGVVYGIDLLEHASVMAGTPVIVPNDYVGQTRQRGRGRENQHRDDKPWSDLIVGSPRVLWEGICTKDELDEMERRFIQDVPVRPRMNWRLNEDNPEQVPKWVQLEQRHQRDDARSVPRWVEPARRARQSLLDWEPPQPARVGAVRRVSVPRKWRPVQVKVGLWSMSWFLIASAAWGFLARNGLLDGWQQRLVCGLIVAPLLIVWSLAGAPISKRQWRRVRRRGWRRWMR